MHHSPDPDDTWVFPLPPPEGIDATRLIPRDVYPKGIDSYHTPSGLTVMAWDHAHVVQHKEPSIWRSPLLWLLVASWAVMMAVIILIGLRIGALG